MLLISTFQKQTYPKNALGHYCFINWCVEKTNLWW